MPGLVRAGRVVRVVRTVEEGEATGAVKCWERKRTSETREGSKRSRPSCDGGKSASNNATYFSDDLLRRPHDVDNGGDGAETSTATKREMEKVVFSLNLLCNSTTPTIPLQYRPHHRS